MSPNPFDEVQSAKAPESATAQAVIPGCLARLRAREDLVRRAAADTLRELGWEPAPGDDAWVALAHRDWDALEKAGAAATEALMTGLRDPKPKIHVRAAELVGRLGRVGIMPLIGALTDLDPRVRTLAERTLRKISPAWRESAEAQSAVAGLISKFRSAEGVASELAAHELARLGWKPETDADSLRHLLLTRNWGRLTELGPAGVATLEAMLQDESPALRGRALEALRHSGDPNALDPLLRGMFASPWTVLAPDGDPVMKLAAVSALSEKLARWAVDAAGFEHKTRDYKYDQDGYISHETADAAIRRLCAVESPVTSNILYLVAQKKDIVFSYSTDDGERQVPVDFAAQRAMALKELARRGNPPYIREAYLHSGGDRARQEGQERAALAAEKLQRYATLMRRIDNPRTDLGENEFTIFEELAQDFPGVAVFERIVRKLASRRELSLSDLNRFETLLSRVGATLPLAETEARLEPLRTPWPRIREAVLRNAAAR